MACFTTLLRQPSRVGGSDAIMHTLRAARRALLDVEDSVAANQSVPVVVLNLPGSAVRRATILQQLKNVGLRGNIVPALFGNDLDIRSLGMLGIVGHDLRQQFPSARDIGCALSHMLLWSELQYSSAPAIVVLEDDAIIGPQFSRVLRDVLPVITDRRRGVDLLSLTWYRHLTNPACVTQLIRPAPSSAPPLIRFHCDGGLNTGFAAYLVTPRGAHRSLAAALPLHASIDLQLGSELAHPLVRPMGLLWLAMRQERSPWVAAHNFSMKSERVYGLDGKANRLAAKRAALNLPYRRRT